MPGTQTLDPQPMTQLHQIQVRYVAVEDRALMRIATQGGAEFRFWVTRRYAAALIAALGRALAPAAAAPAAADEPKRSAMLAFEREAALARADFGTEYQAQSSQTPLGDEPILLARIAARRDANGITVLSLHPRTGRGIDIRLNDTLIHSLLKLIEDAARSGDWALPAVLTEAPRPQGQPLN